MTKVTERLIAKLLIFILIINLSFTSSGDLLGASFAETTDGLKLTIESVKTGTIDFNTDKGAGHHPGYDYSETDEFVRTLDLVKYKLDFGVINESDMAENLKLTATLSQSGDGKTVATWDGLPSGAVLSNDDRTFSYELGNKTGGEALSISPSAFVKESAKDGDAFSMSVSLDAGNMNLVSTSSAATIVSRNQKQT